MRVRFITRAFAIVRIATVAVAVVSFLKFGLLEWFLCAVATSFKVASLQIERMASVDIAVNRVTHVSSVDGRSEIIVETKTMDAFTETIKIVVLGKSVDKFDKLILVNKVVSFGSEYNISSGAAGHREPEGWIITPVKCKVEIFM